MIATTKILISACLLGDPVRFDGQSKALIHPLLSRWQAEQRLIKLCPELAGGLKTPRDAAQIQGGDGFGVLQRKARVITKNQNDLSAYFIRGALKALETAQSHGIKIALLKANSPSCSNESIYDGQFSGLKTKGMGVTAALLSKHGISVYNENQMNDLSRELTKLDLAVRAHSQNYKIN